MYNMHENSGIRTNCLVYVKLDGAIHDFSHEVGAVFLDLINNGVMHRERKWFC